MLCMRQLSWLLQKVHIEYSDRFVAGSNVSMACDSFCQASSRPST